MRHRLTLGEFVAFNAYLTMLTWPMIAFGWVTNMLQRGTASWKRMLEVIDAQPAVADGPGLDEASAGTPVRGGIEIRSLTFAYNGVNVLTDISLRVDAGQTMAIVGPTGSGKTTLVNLLPRLYEPPRGTVFVDGMDVRDMPLSRLRGAIGYVAQEPFLFSESLGDNVAFGVTDSDDGRRSRTDAIAGASAIARLDTDVRDFRPATTRWSGSAGSRSQEARSSAPRSPGP